jgi:hypothetical protein
VKGKKKIPLSQKQLDILKKGRDNRKKNIAERKEKKKDKK